MRLGSDYHTNLSVEEVTEIICSESEQLGYIVTQPEKSNDIIRFKTYCSSIKTSLKALLRRIPTEVYWEVSNQKNETRIYCDTKLKGMYSLFLTGSFFIFVTLYLLGIHQIISINYDDVQPRITSLLLVILSVIIFNLHSLLLNRSPHQELSLIFFKILNKSINKNSHLLKTKTYFSRLQIRLTIYVSLSFIVFLFPIKERIEHSISTASLSFSVTTLFMPLFIFAFSLAFFVYYLRKREKSNYVEIVLSGITSISIPIALFFLLVIALIWIDQSLTLPIGFEKIFAECKKCFIERIHPEFLNSKEIFKITDIIKTNGRALWILTIIFLLSSIYIITIARQASVKNYPLLFQVIKYSNKDLMKNYLEEKQLLKKGRVLLFILLMIVYLIFLFEFSTILYCFIKPNNQSNLNFFDVSICYAFFALDAPFNSRFTSLIIHFFWGTYISTLLLLLFFPPLSFVIQYLSFKLKIKNKTNYKSELEKKIINRFVPIWKKNSSLPFPSFVFTQSDFPIAKAFNNGLFSKTTTIEISKGCIDILTSNELDAVVAHEMVHCLKKHCRHDHIIRFIGRLTFVGDHFIRSLQNTFETEIEADRLAVECFSTNPNDLINAILNIRNKAFICEIQKYHGFSKDFCEMNSIDSIFQKFEDNLTTLKFKKQFAFALQLFIRQYFDINNIGYWHPSINYRIEVLSKMIQEKNSTS